MNGNCLAELKTVSDFENRNRLDGNQLTDAGIVRVTFISS